MAKEKEKKKTIAEIEVPDNISVEIDNAILKVKGKKGEATRNFFDPLIEIKKQDKKILIVAKKKSKKMEKRVNTFKAHIRNMFIGVENGYTYILKICSSHFPMNVSISKDELIVKNFFGERKPRVLKIKEGVNVKLDGDQIIVESVDKEKAGNFAASIEALTRRPGYDTRIFQDGIYIISKAGKELLK